MAKRRVRPSRVRQADRQDRTWAVVRGLVVLVLGLALAAVTGGYKWHLARKAERLRAEGVPVVAQVLERRNSMGRGGGRDTIVVSYAYAGTTYTKRILCDGPSGCDRNPPPEIVVRVDPVKPAEFVTNNGSTDDSAFIFNSNGGIPYGLVAAAVGAGMLMSARLAGRRATPGGGSPVDPPTRRRHPSANRRRRSANRRSQR
ncbi:hypothetical protein GCM10027290_07560 [Micromonospora sonneratiae]|uniref:DUF3592 domain-containing protein n=1 Tax=Micromonospora sonneratiae TaxID=1184706 RepID=A0ABW3YBY0_9ACTN